MMTFKPSCFLLVIGAVTATPWIIPWDDLMGEFHSPAIQLRPAFVQWHVPQRPAVVQRPPQQQQQPTSSSQSCECGWVNRARIIDGKETGQNEYPPMVALQLARTGHQFCGGTILTRWHVVSAAHCTDGRSPREIVVSVGAHNLRNVENNRNIHTLSAIVQHEHYDRRNINNDIVLLVTESPISFNRLVGPACLPRGRMNLEGEVVKALGWGHTQNRGVSSDVLQEVDLKVIRMHDCKKVWRSVGQSGAALPQRSINICTDHPTKDTCQGDSGGPLIWLDPRTNRYAIVGLVSYGSDCGGFLPGVNTDVGAFLGWIRSTIQATRPGVTACSLA